MTLGEHLDELRGCLIRSLLGLILAVLVCIWPAKYLLVIAVRPLVLALRANDQLDTLLATSPVETIVVYIKVVMTAAIIIAGPYALYQFWTFVAAGLYKHERRWVNRLVPISIGLFILGVVFMYVFALVLALNFLVGFSTWFKLPDPTPTMFERSVLHIDEPDASSQPSPEEWPEVPIFAGDPEEPPPGGMWLNTEQHRVKWRVHLSGDEWRTYSIQLQRDDHRSMIAPHFKIGEYLSFVLVLTIAFGLAFQMPLVVVFLIRANIVSGPTFRKYRKLVILLIVFIAGMIAPPDLLSHLLLSGPMVLLFEIGLRIGERGKARADRARAAAAGADDVGEPR